MQALLVRFNFCLSLSYKDFFFFEFLSNLYTQRGSNSQPRDQESPVLPAEPALPLFPTVSLLPFPSRSLSLLLNFCLLYVCPPLSGYSTRSLWIQHSGRQAGREASGGSVALWLSPLHLLAAPAGAMWQSAWQHVISHRGCRRIGLASLEAGQFPACRGFWKSGGGGRWTGRKSGGTCLPSNLLPRSELIPLPSFA